MKLVINHEVWENKTLEQIIKILDEYIPKDDYQSLSLDTGTGCTIQKTCKKADWQVTKNKILLHIVKERLSTEVSSCNKCLDCIFHV